MCKAQETIVVCFAAKGQLHDPTKGHSRTTEAGQRRGRVGLRGCAGRAAPTTRNDRGAAGPPRTGPHAWSGRGPATCKWGKRREGACSSAAGAAARHCQAAQRERLTSCMRVTRAATGRDADTFLTHEQRGQTKSRAGSGAPKERPTLETRANDGRCDGEPRARSASGEAALQQ